MADIFPEIEPASEATAKLARTFGNRFEIQTDEGLIIVGYTWQGAAYLDDIIDAPKGVPTQQNAGGRS